MDFLLNIARTLRLWLYNLTSARFMGIEIDVILHLGVAALAFYWVEGRMGARRAAVVLAVMIVAKEVADVFLKSQLRYIRSPTPEVLIDIVVDIAMGIAGGWLAWWWRRRRTARPAAAA